jgi:hypothetical protein
MANIKNKDVAYAIEIKKSFIKFLNGININRGLILFL